MLSDFLSGFENQTNKALGTEIMSTRYPDIGPLEVPPVME